MLTFGMKKGTRLFGLLVVAACVLSAQVGTMRGFADIHNHQFANHYMGGYTVAGRPYGPIQEALGVAECLRTENGGHSPNHAFDYIGSSLAGFFSLPFPPTYGNDGWPTFRGWPAFWEVSHQKVHEDFLKRAVDGGLRLMVMFAVESHKGCQAVKNGGGRTDGRDCNDEMSSIYNQLDDAYNMQRAVNREAGGDGLGWYRIVTTPAQARQVIGQGKLAVILGVETSQLFNCHSEPCDWQAQENLTRLWNKGVRHFFPIHHGDNAFGGPSYFTFPLQQGSLKVNLVPNVNGVPPYKLNTRWCGYAWGECNTLGLTATGEAFIKGLMQLGAIIDIDHMSDLAAARTLELAEANNYPVVASHAGFNDINKGNQDHEGQLTREELHRIQNLGGMVGLISSQGSLDQVRTYSRPGKHTVSHICGRTTETFAQAYYYALDNAPGMSIAIGTDLNGPLRQVSPRFGYDQCDSAYKFSPPPRNKWNVKLNYPFVARASNTQLYPLRTGDRLWDFNTDGLAHVGLLPEMLADLETLEISPEDLEPLFNSAEGYVKMWERADERAHSISLPNGGFEAGSLTSWSVYSLNSGFAANVASGAGRNGSTALAESNAGGIVFQDVPGLTPGKAYLVSAWVNFSSDANAKAELSVHDTQGGNFAQSFRDPKPGWQQVSLLYTADSTGIVRVHLVRQDGVGTIFWDDISLVEAPPNGGFEAGSLSSWGVYSPQSGFNATVIAGMARSGSYSLSESTGEGIVFQDISGLTPGKTYMISTWLAAPSGASPSAGELYVHDTNGGNLIEVFPKSGTGWQQLSLLYKADTTGSVRIHLVHHAAADTLYWDDVAIAPNER